MRTWNLLCSRFAFDSCRPRSRTGHSSLVSADLLQVKFFHRATGSLAGRMSYHIMLTLCSGPPRLFVFLLLPDVSHLYLVVSPPSTLYQPCSGLIIAHVKLPLVFLALFFCHSPRPPFCLAVFVVSPFLTSPGVQNLTVIKSKIFWTLYSSGPWCELCHTAAQRKPHNHFIK